MRTFAKKPKATRQTTSTKSRTPSRSHFGQSREVSSILHLQRTIGNHAEEQLLRAESTDLKASSASNMSRGFVPDSSRIPVHPPAGGLIQAVEEDPLQGKLNPGDSPAHPQADSRELKNHTGMPGRLKSGLESLSGMDLSGVRVHCNSAEPAQVDALAYTQGQDIHLGPGQEKHLPHEGWHVVQQMQGRVRPTIQAKGVLINDDMGLEREAAAMGAKALQKEKVSNNSNHARAPDTLSRSEKEEKPIQRELKSMPLQRQDDDRAHEQKFIWYEVDEKQEAAVPKTKTHWGTVPDAVDDSYLKSLIAPYWTGPSMSRGVGRIAFNMSFVDWRDAVYLNDQFLPSGKAGLRWEHRRGHERMAISPGVTEYNPDGGGGLAVTAQYSYGGYRMVKGQKVGFHNLLFNITYDSKMSTTSGASVEVGAEYKGASAKVSASSSVSVSKAALSFVREIAFHSYEM